MDKTRAKNKTQKNIKLTPFCNGRLADRCADTGETQGDYIERLIHEDYIRHTAAVAEQADSG